MSCALSKKTTSHLLFLNGSVASFSNLFLAFEGICCSSTCLQHELKLYTFSEFSGCIKRTRLTGRTSVDKARYVEQIPSFGPDWAHNVMSRQAKGDTIWDSQSSKAAQKRVDSYPAGGDWQQPQKPQCSRQRLGSEARAAWARGCEALGKQ